MTRPNSEDILKPLKSFQRRTVDHAFHRLFVAPDSTARFLVADEVGLGKTLVARGVIARAIDHLWEDVERIDVVYICSNASIARANLPKLRIGAGNERSLALATRLTMLATELAPGSDRKETFSDAKLNFVSFTPGTSFNMGHSSGRAPERQVLFQLLEPFATSTTTLMNMLQGGIRNKDGWRRRLKDARVALEADIEVQFQTKFENSELLDQFSTLGASFRRHRPVWPAEARSQRNRFIADLRRLLAETCVQALEPDLVIFDEFQRFKPLLETRADQYENNPGAALAQALFKSRTPEGQPVRTLLLSATPYKLYTADAEIEHEDHYKDFLATARFLLDDEDRVRDVQRRLSSFGTELKRAAQVGPSHAEAVAAAKGAVEASLRAVMARTERVPATDDRDAMVEERRQPGKITATEVQQYMATDALFRTVGDGDPMRFWKSAPYLAHFMHGYKFNERLDETIRLSPDKVLEVIRTHKSAFLNDEEIRSWELVEPANAKLRQIVSDLLDEGLWRLLWIPPTMPYWPLEGPFEGKRAFTKTLLFSAWNVVPDVVSAVLSYEAERRMVGVRQRVKKYEEPATQQRPLLRFAETGKRSGHRMLWLLLPCLTLADQAHPLEAPDGRDRRDWTLRQVKTLLRALPNPRRGETDRRWEWAVPLLLDPGLRDFLREWRDNELNGLSESEALPKPNEEAFDAYLDELLDLDITELGPRPPGLAELIADAALGSPAVLASRCLKTSGIDDHDRRRLATAIAHAFWSLFNQPAVISLLRQLPVETGATRDDGAYWHRVLRYCKQGNLQAVLDEQWHLLWEQHAWSDTADREELASQCAEALVHAAPPTRSRVHARFFRQSSESAVETEEIRIRTIFAQRFGHIHAEDEGQISQDAVRAAFNSPFRPFVLVSTSIGQEGLDFHPWCHRVVHWDLPGNPVDLEQREGRVHRYKGHAVRRNVAAAHGQEALADRSSGDDVWERVFALAGNAARARADSDLVPHWIAPGECRVQRNVPLLPYTKEVEAFERLKRQLAAYRVVFGQPRQEDLVNLLDQADLNTAQLKEWAVDLTPP